MQKILLFCTLVFSLMLRGQTISVPDEASEQIKYLKEGALLVRLQTKDRAIKELMARGREKEAQKVGEQQRLENKQIMFSFQQQFDFCPVYFFYGEDSKSIKAGNLQGILFDNDLNFIETPPQKFLLAEFGETPNLKLESFMILDHEGVILNPPFPYFQRKYHFLNLLTYSKPQMIEHINAKFHKSYCFYHCTDEQRED